jgi:hypothetical protein
MHSINLTQNDFHSNLGTASKQQHDKYNNFGSFKNSSANFNTSHFVNASIKGKYILIEQKIFIYIQYILLKI